MPNPKFPLQRRLFDLLSAHYKSRNQSWLKQYALTHGLAKTTAYNHAGGQVAMSFDAGITLMQQHALPLSDLVFSNSDGLPDEGVPAGPSSDSVSEFLNRLLPLMCETGNTSTNGMYHFCEDQPVFWLKQMRLLALFKFYFWKRFLCNDPAWRIPFHEKLDALEPFHGYLQKSRQLRDAFLHSPRTECWSVGMFDKLIEQIRYTRDVGGFAAAHLPGFLLEQIDALVSSMEEQARKGENVFLANELFATGNFLFIRKTDADFLVMLQEWPTVMIIQPSGETNHLAQRVGHLIERMLPIGGGAERERKLFFDRVRRRLVLQPNA